MNRYKKLGVTSLLLLLTACSTQLRFPDHLYYHNEKYQKVTDNRIDQMRQSLYLKSGSQETPDNWRTGILLFSDKNPENKTLEQRLASRKETMVYLPDTYVHYAIEPHYVDGQPELRSKIIYQPTEYFKFFQLEITRGRNLPCGYGQIQLADKRFAFAQDQPNYQQEIKLLASHFDALDWQLECR